MPVAMFAGWNFVERRCGEVRRIPIPRSFVNKGMKKGQGSCGSPGLPDYPLTGYALEGPRPPGSGSPFPDSVPDCCK